jgi:hypothetical protein
MSNEKRTTWIGGAPGGNYTDKLKEAGEKLTPGQVHEVDVCHDDWCAIFRDNPCNCEPEIRPRTRK